jgi:circadian clock protein KaiA
LTDNPLHSRLSICIFVGSASLTQSLTEQLGGDRYVLNYLSSPKEFREFVEQNKEQIDCLIIDYDLSLLSLFNQLYEKGVLLPAIFIGSEETSLANFNGGREKTLSEYQQRAIFTHIYHSGELRISLRELGQIISWIDRAITQFLHLGPSCAIAQSPLNRQRIPEIDSSQNFLLLQQRRLAEKLKERLGYLGVYYKRNPQYFYRHLSQPEKEELIQQLAEEYRYIILNYFAKDETINQMIDQFVSRAFFTDISVSQVLEIHMELMDDFAQQLKLEGRNEEILLDYRLALIDIIAHLCEMYRRSIPREDLPFEVLFPVD